MLVDSVENVMMHGPANPKHTNYIGVFNPLNAELNPIRHLLALLAAHHILHVSRIRVNTDHMALPSAPRSIDFSQTICFPHVGYLTFRDLPPYIHVHAKTVPLTL